MGVMIDYLLLARAIGHYAALGYHQVEVPWMISREACFATLAEEDCHKAFQIKDKYLVGSAEQGFLELNLAPGRYMSVSPCFRNETVDDLHQQTFVKLELHNSQDTDGKQLHDMIHDAMELFVQLSPDGLDVTKTPQGYDIEIDHIEVGSYGRRSAMGRTWLYGTGLALPRINQVINRQHLPYTE